MRIRVLKVLVHDGKAEEFKAFLLGAVLPQVQSRDGLIDVIVGLPDKSSPNLFLMLSIWRDQAAIEAFAGKDWRAPAIIGADERRLVLEAFVDHYEMTT